MKVAYKIHKVDTPLRANDRGRLVPAGLWWNGTEWDSPQEAATYYTNQNVFVPANGEWVQIYLNETTEGNN